MPLSSFQSFVLCAVWLPLSTTNNTVMFIGFHGKFNMFQELVESCITCTQDFPESTITMATVCCFWVITLCGSFFWHLLLREAFYLGSGPLILMQDDQACNSKKEMSWWLSQLYLAFLVLIVSSIHSTKMAGLSSQVMGHVYKAEVERLLLSYMNLNNNYSANHSRQY